MEVITLAEYKSNSFKSKEEARQQEQAATKEKLKKVVSGKASTRQSKSRKLTEMFVSEDASTVKSYVVTDVIVPAIKKLVYDIFTDGIDIILYGGNGRGGKSRESKVSYANYYKNRRDDRRPNEDRFASRNRFDYADIEYDSRADAQYVLDEMKANLRIFGLLSIADQYDLSGLTAPYTSDKYGWTKLDEAYVERTRSGYIIKTPKAVPID